MKKLFVAAVAALCMTSPATAQMMEEGNASLEGVTSLYGAVRGYLVATAEQASEELYQYRPTEEVRSFGEILGHVANAGYAFCAGATGMDRPQMGNAEELETKAEIVEALKASFAFCDDAYNMDGGMADESVTFFGQSHTRLSVLAFNAAHDFEHYGNLVTYMRINGMVPPSSQGM